MYRAYVPTPPVHDGLYFVKYTTAGCTRGWTTATVDYKENPLCAETAKAVHTGWLSSVGGWLDGWVKSAMVAAAGSAGAALHPMMVAGVCVTHVSVRSCGSAAHAPWVM